MLNITEFSKQMRATFMKTTSIERATEIVTKTDRQADKTGDTQRQKKKEGYGNYT